MKGKILRPKYVITLFVLAFAFSCTHEDGMDGIDGKDGIDGVDGINGQDGEDGIDGQDGVDGQDGTDGADGQDGQDGVDGQDGQDGADGQDARTYTVGELAQGGIIFWLDNTKQHGLACSMTDLNDGEKIRWYAGTFGLTRATGDGFYAGENNTTIIISSSLAIGDDGSPYAAILCNELNVYQGGVLYGDWYLPSGRELRELRSNKDIVNQTALTNEGDVLENDYYWTSTENQSVNAWGYNLGANTGATLTKSSVHYVRAVRAF